MADCKYQRNREIYLLYCCGHRFASIARRFKISATRVKQIVDKEESFPRKK